MLHPLEQVRDHQNPLADPPALAARQAPQLGRPGSLRKKYAGIVDPRNMVRLPDHYTTSGKPVLVKRGMVRIRFPPAASPLRTQFRTAINNLPAGTRVWLAGDTDMPAPFDSLATAGADGRSAGPVRG